MAQRQPKITDIVRPQKRPLYTKKHFYTFVIVGILVLLSLWFGWQWSQSDMRTIDKDTYQVVSLTNDQIYFGKITSIDDKIVTMENVYYMANSAPKTEEQDVAGSTSVLRPLDKAIYGPRDILYLRKNQVVSWQNLKNDSQVVKTILSR
jgi:hypothetical protein